MREIRFRIWNPGGNNMLYDISNVYECLMQQIAFNESQPRHERLIKYDHVADGMVWMQFTGLKDKNGVDVYESDIVTIVEVGRKYTLEFIDYGFKLVHADPKLNRMIWGSLSRLPELNFTIEVSGNIYQNQELLK